MTHATRGIPCEQGGYRRMVDVSGKPDTVKQPGTHTQAVH